MLLCAPSGADPFLLFWRAYLRSCSSYLKAKPRHAIVLSGAVISGTVVNEALFVSYLTSVIASSESLSPNELADP